MILITGATDGIGKETALQLAKKGHDIIIHGRSEKRIEDTMQFLKAETGCENIFSIKADLSSLKEVKLMVDELKDRFQNLRVLVNNAGVYVKNYQQSKDGFEMSFAVNYLSHFFLSISLLSLLSKHDDARIVNVSSLTHAWATPKLENINDEKGYDAQNAYALSKLFNLMFSHEMHRRYKDKICVNALHPGVISTKLLHAAWLGGDSVEKGAETSVFLAHADKTVLKCGRYWTDNELSNEASYAHDEQLCAQLWQISVDMVNKALEEKIL